MFGLEFNRNQKLAFYVLVGLAIIGLSYAHVTSSRLGSSDEVVIEEPSHGDGTHVTADDSDNMPTATTIRNSGKVICDVCGCVKKPGVYILESGKRVIDAIKAAGGARPNADLRAINLAAKVEDGSKIEVLSLQETKSALISGLARVALTETGKAPRRSSGDPNGKLSVPGEGLVHINAADVEQLQQLPGVGPSTAQKIIDHRATIGRFTQPEQLMDVKGIGPKKFEKMRPFVAL